MSSADTLDAILQHLPEIMRRLFGRHPVPRVLQGLSMRQFRTMRFITEHPGCTMGEIARALEVTLGAATGMVERLHQRGLVARVPDPADRRRVCLQLTEVGRRTHLEAVRHARQEMRRALASLTHEQQQQIADVLRLLREALGAGRD